MDTTFIYFLKDPENPKKGYVGKADNPGERLSEHLYECCTEKHYRANWLKSLTARGLKPTVEVVDEIPFEHWPQLEVAYIEFFREQGYELTNGTPGGEDPPSWAGKKHTSETLAKMRGVKQGKKNPNFGKPLSPEERAHLSALWSGEKNPMFGKRGAEHPAFGYVPSPAECAARRIKKAGARSEFYGVSQHMQSGKWRARIHVSGKEIHLGRFVSEVEAAEVYDMAAKIHHGAHAVLNFPD